MEHDTSILEAALTGYQAKLTRITQAMAEIRTRLERGQARPHAISPRTRRKLSAAARKRMAAGQKKRWAEYHKQRAERQA